MRGISPVVATLLLIGIVVALAILLYTLSTSLFQQGAEEDIRRSVIPFTVEFYVDPFTSRQYDMEAMWKFYLVVTEPRTYYEAIEECRRRGMTLMTSYMIDSFQVSRIANLLSSKGITKAWVGIYQKERTVEPDGGWVNFALEPFERVPISWAAGQPDNNNGIEHVAALRSDGTLEDLNALERLPFICERYLFSFTYKNLSKDKQVPNADVWVSLYSKIDDRLASYITDRRLNYAVGVTVPPPDGRTIYVNYFSCKYSNVDPGVSNTCKVVMLDTSNTAFFNTKTTQICLTIGAGTQCATLRT